MFELDESVFGSVGFAPLTPRYFSPIDIRFFGSEGGDIVMDGMSGISVELLLDVNGRLDTSVWTFPEPSFPFTC